VVSSPDSQRSSRKRNDLSLGPIVGGLAHDRAHLWGRADGPGVLYAWLGQKPDLSDAQLAATSLPLTAETGFAGVAPVVNLAPDSHYQYALTLNDSPPDPAQGEYPAFTTFPSPGERAPFAFAFGSCFRPTGENGGQIFRALEARRQADNLRFVLLIGDQIYADADAYNGIGKIACTLQEYRDVYTSAWSRPPLRQLLANLPAFMTLDDHEVDNDWHWLDSSRRWAAIPWREQLWRWLRNLPPQERRLPRKRVQDALQAYWEHQGMHAPGFELPLQINLAGQYALSAEDPGSLAYTFTYGAAAFFVLDTRTMRVKNRRERSMLGEGQWRALEAWLLAVKEAYPVKFLVTSSAVLFQMWLDIFPDRWWGFPEERERLLRLLVTNAIEGVYLLAGDLHSAHAVSAGLSGPQGRTLPLWEFCSTPFEAKPNWLARYTYLPLRSRWVKRTRRYFTLDQWNFGVVRVHFPEKRRPRVHFEVYGEKGELLGEAGD